MSHRPGTARHADGAGREPTCSMPTRWRRRAIEVTRSRLLPIRRGSRRFETAPISRRDVRPIALHGSDDRLEFTFGRPYK